MTTLVRMEYLTANGWVVGHAGIALLNPQGYVDRLAAKRKFGRCIELDDRLQPTGTVWAPAKLPNRKDLRPSDTRVPHLPDPTDQRRCPWCEKHHGDPFDGSCLI